MGMRFRSRWLGVGVVALAASGLPRLASGEPIALTVSVSPSLQQTANSPCVIGDPSCTNPTGMSYTLIGPKTPSSTVNSPTYTVQQLRELIGGNLFSIGVDLNQAMGQDGGAYNLLAFTMSVNGTVVFSTSGASTLTPQSVGNGYSDASIRGFDLSNFAPTDKIVFTTTFSGATAGREQYFLQAPLVADSHAPEPASMILLGTGLAGVAAARFRKKTVTS